jgi:hypothetical protein
MSYEAELKAWEEKRKLFYERLDNGYYRDRCLGLNKVPVVAVPVTAAIAEEAKANLEGVAIVIRRPDKVTLYGRPQRNRLGLGVRVGVVQEVDDEGKVRV